jgi:hypothetical protein
VDAVAVICDDRGVRAPESQRLNAVVRSRRVASLACAFAALVLGLSAVSVTPAAGPPRHRDTTIDFTGGRYAGQGLKAIFEAVGTDPRLSDWGGTDPPLYDEWGMSTDPNQRVHLAKVGGRLGSWQELRSTDGPWTASLTNLAKSSLDISQEATWGPAGFAWGIERWFAWDYYLPLNVGGVSFEFPRSWNTLGDMHTGMNSTHADPGLTGVLPSGSVHPKYITFQTSPDTNRVRYLTAKLLQLTKRGGARIASAFNTWHEVVIGMRTGYDKTAWIEVWHDGVLKLARTHRPLFASSEDGPYFQLQNYTPYPTSYVGGGTRSAIVYGGFRAGMTRLDVQTRFARR